MKISSLRGVSRSSLRGAQSSSLRGAPLTLSLRRSYSLSIFLVLFLSFYSSGCVLLIGGAVGAAGVYAVSKDTMEGETDTPYADLWKTAVTVSRIRGTIVEKDSLKGNIQLKVDSSKAYISLIRITDATTKVRVSARKYHFPNLALAQEIFVKILEGAE